MCVRGRTAECGHDEALEAGDGSARVVEILQEEEVHVDDRRIAGCLYRHGSGGEGDDVCDQGQYFVSWMLHLIGEYSGAYSRAGRENFPRNEDVGREELAEHVDDQAAQAPRADSVRVARHGVVAGTRRVVPWPARGR